MAVNSYKWPLNGWNGLKWIEMTGNALTCLELLKMSKHAWKWLELARMAEMAGNGWKWLKISKMARTG